MRRDNTYWRNSRGRRHCADLKATGVSPAPRVSPLVHRDFRLLLGGSAISVLGDQFTLVALPWLGTRLESVFRKPVIVPRIQRVCAVTANPGPGSRQFIVSDDGSLA
jgi:hypothetical protein